MTTLINQRTIPQSNFALMIVGLAMLLLASCQKWEDKPGKSDPRLARKYCNNPEAVNYNWGFPGTPDSSECFYPSDVFAGTFNFYDSVYNAADSVISTNVITATFRPVNRTRFVLYNFCSSDTLRLTATKYFTSSLDTLLPHGQLFCRSVDTVSGIFFKKATDTITYTMNVWSDTTFNVHKGRAYRQL